MSNAFDTQKEWVIEHLTKYGSITPWQAIQQYGITRLGAIIFILRKEGFDITTNRVNSVNRFGHNCNFAEYVLEREYTDDTI